MSVLQGEEATIGTILRANSLVKEFKRTSQFELIFRPIDFRRAGIVAVSDAALGNVQRSGASTGTPLEKVYSQAGYVIMIADEALVHGNCGSFNVLDSRSHRIPGYADRRTQPRRFQLRRPLTLRNYAVDFWLRSAENPCMAAMWTRPSTPLP